MKHGKYKRYIKYKRHRKRKTHLIKRVIVGSFCNLIIAIAALTAVYLWKLYSATVSSDVSIYVQEDVLLIVWDTSFELDACRLFRYDEGTEKYVSSGEYRNGLIMVNSTETEEAMRLRLQAIRYESFFGRRMTLLGFSRDVTVNLMEATKPELQMNVDLQNKTATVSWQGDESRTYEVYLVDNYGKCQLYSATADNTITLDFTKEFELPERNAPVMVVVRAVCKEPDYMLYGPLSENLVITCADLFENNLSLCWEPLDERQYVLNWQECSGGWYEVQQWSEREQQWESRCILGRAEEMTYTTEHLPSNRQVRFRVITYDNVKERDQGVYQAEPSEAIFYTGMSPLYCTIWPIVPLEITDKPQGKEILGEVPAGQALCVLEENGGCFKISYKEYLGYIDSRFCMINLPEYMGDLCEYDITNSISSIFRVHEYDIPGITDRVIKGYENICLGNGDYLVPYLYPCTAKLYQAVLSAAGDGYGLRIYDAFRPNEATRYLYDTVESIIDKPIMGEEFDGMTQMPEGNGVLEAVQINEEPLEKKSLQEAYDTYRSVMTDGSSYRLSSFLAASVSAHNRGIALDLVLIDTNTKENLLMQSDMHDLSWYSVITRNNENAHLLAKYMKDAGYADLSSEWWHFQDDETREAIKLNSYLATGISIEGWKRDDTGWKYRLKDGSYYKDKTVLIDGDECVFDVEGYCIREGLEE